MAQAFRCDRCGEYYDPYDPSELDVLINVARDEGAVRYPIMHTETPCGQTFKRDLCKDCRIDLAQWWRKGRECAKD